MDTERIKSLLKEGIKAGQKTRAARQTVKMFEDAKQDAYDATAALVEPITDIQKELAKKSEKIQEDILEQLKANQANVRDINRDVLAELQNIENLQGEDIIIIIIIIYKTYIAPMLEFRALHS